MHAHVFADFWFQKKFIENDHTKQDLTDYIAESYMPTLMSSRVPTNSMERFVYYKNIYFHYFAVQRYLWTASSNLRTDELSFSDTSLFAVFELVFIVDNMESFPCFDANYHDPLRPIESVFPAM
jgi:hypothetical protein